MHIVPRGEKSMRVNIKCVRGDIKDYGSRSKFQVLRRKIKCVRRERTTGEKRHES